MTPSTRALKRLRQTWIADAERINETGGYAARADVIEHALSLERIAGWRDAERMAGKKERDFRAMCHGGRHPATVERLGTMAETLRMLRLDLRAKIREATRG